MKVVFLDAVHSILEERLLANGFVCVTAIKLNYENCLKTLSNADGIVIRSRFKLNSDVLSNCHSLNFIARPGSGLENIDLNSCKEYILNGVKYEDYLINISNTNNLLPEKDVSENNELQEYASY